MNPVVKKVALTGLIAGLGALVASLSTELGTYALIAGLIIVAASPIISYLLVVRGARNA